MKILRTEKTPIWDDNEDVYLKAYFINDRSQEENRPAVIICPGGGYLCVSESESDPVALRFADAGYQPFVLNYSIMEQARYRNRETFKPVLELEKAFEIVHSRADQWHIDSRKIVLIGFSAGGHLAASYCVCKDKDYMKPAALLLSYPLIDYKYLNNSWCSQIGDDQIDLYQLATRKVFGTAHPSEEQRNALDVNTQVSEQMPPTFLCHALDDRVIDVESSVCFDRKLKSLGVPSKLYLFEKGIHGEPFFDAAWFELAVKWLKGIMNDK